LIAPRAEAVILVSERMRGFIPASVRASVIPTGLDFDEIPSMLPAEARWQLGLSPSDRLILFVGDPAEPVKRYRLAEQAVEVLNRTYAAKLLVGWGMPRERILILMNACDALVMTSIQEGSPCVVKEALACNLPIVSVNVGDVPVRLNGVAGCEVCADERPETIAASLERVLRRGQRTRGREAVRNLDERLLARQIIGVYRSALTTTSEPGVGIRARLSVANHS
jgi:teichuronic acid biosynthesis glycosyltransferase TuaC